MYDPMKHPLVEPPKIIIDEDGEEQESINSWTYAAKMLVVLMDPLAAIHRNSELKSVLKFAHEVIPLVNPDVNVEDLLYRATPDNEEVMRQLHALLAYGTEEKTRREYGEEEANA